MWSLFFQAGVRRCVSFLFLFCLFFKEKELGLIVFVEHRVKENKGQQAELEERLF